MSLTIRSVAITLTFSTLAASCGSVAPTPQEPPPHPSVAAASSAPLVPPAPSAAPTSSPATEPAPAKAPRAETVPELAHFYAALRGLEEKTRKSHVRVYWMGDSHAQADFWSGAVRDALQGRFGDAGPGFMHLGYKDYRHDGAKFTTGGKWRMRPKKPSGIKHEADGVFGLGGILMGGYADQPDAVVDLSRPTEGSFVYDFCYRLKAPADTIDIDVDGQNQITLKVQKGEPAGTMEHVTFTGPAPGRVNARPSNGSPDFCGLTAETDPNVAPGVVLDTLGINGARYATALSWDDKAWESEVARRPPDLVVFEYGTNEAGDASPAAEKTGTNVDLLLSRIRKVNPNADCVIVSATDRADAEERVPLINAQLVQAAKRTGCLYYDAYTVLGGKGSMAKMRDEPEPRAQKDGIHMTIQGYRALGKAMAETLLAGY